MIKVYALIPNRKPMHEQEKKPSTSKRDKESLDYMDSWLKAIKDMGQNMKGEK